MRIFLLTLVFPSSAPLDRAPMIASQRSPLAPRFCASPLSRCCASFWLVQVALFMSLSALEQRFFKNSPTSMITTLVFVATALFAPGFYLRVSCPACCLFSKVPRVFFRQLSALFSAGDCILVRLFSDSPVVCPSSSMWALRHVSSRDVIYKACTPSPRRAPTHRNCD